jgi:hypothetical protein
MWATIVHGPSGGYGDEAVVLWPASRATRRQPGHYSWRLGGHWATVEGFLASGPRRLLRRYVRIRDGRPVVRESDAYPVTVTVPAEPTLVREIRYDAGQLGPAGQVLGGLVFTGVTRTGALDDWLVSQQPDLSGDVGGVPAVVTPIFGGNAALAWEPKPGTVAYVGYSGAELSPRTVDALRCLADQSRALPLAKWHPQAVSESAP